MLDKVVIDIYSLCRQNDYAPFFALLITHRSMFWTHGYSLRGSKYTTPEHKCFCKYQRVISVDQLGSNDTHLGVKVFLGRILEGFLVPAPPLWSKLFSTMRCWVSISSEASADSEMSITFVPRSIGLSSRNSGGEAVSPPECGLGSRETRRPGLIDRADTLFIGTSESDGKLTPVFSFK